ncbi:hypothetical protein WL82_19355 [Burkholderia ubonensis]|nr:hypothetical protein WJ98_03000 [Burkholderia ubonensis]KWF00910.1 hypothetical protein WL82_19355 [Burkholderia ubonensis]
MRCCLRRQQPFLRTGLLSMRSTTFLMNARTTCFGFWDITPAQSKRSSPAFYTNRWTRSLVAIPVYGRLKIGMYRLSFWQNSNASY